MEITIREAAPLLGRSERAVRAKIARGELPARRDGRTWRIPLATLPLTAAQRESLQIRSEQVRQAVDAVLPSQALVDRQHRRRSVLDLIAFARGSEVLRSLGALEPCDEFAECTRRLKHALADLAAAAFEFQPRIRADALREVRADIGRVIGLLLTTAHPDPAWRECALRLENDVIPPIGGLLRQAERRQRP